MSQMTKLLVTLVVLLALAAGVGLYAWKGVFEQDTHEAKVKDVNERLFSPAKAEEKNTDGATATIEFTRLRMTSKDETTTLEREPGKDWKMTTPVTANVDKIAVDGVVSQLQQSKFKYIADESPDDAALVKYGLKDPSFTVEADALVGDSQLKRSVTLVGGAENSFNGSIFMQRNGEKQVWGAEGGVKWSLQKTTLELRDKDVLSFDDANVKSIDVKSKSGAFTLERDTYKDWRVTPTSPPPKKGDEKFLADNAAVSTNITALKNEKAGAFPVDTAAARAKYGLDAPQVDLTLKLENDSIRIRLGKGAPTDGGSEHVYALREGGGTTVLAEVPARTLTHFDVSPYDLRDKSVAYFRRDLAAGTVLHNPGSARDIVVVKDTSSDAGTGETWKVIAPEAGPAQQFKMAALLWTLGSIKYAKVTEEKPKDLKKYGLDATARWVGVTGFDGKEIARLTIGKDVPGAAGQKYMLDPRGEVVEADATRLADLPNSVHDMLDLPRQLSDAGFFDAGPSGVFVP